MNELPDQTRLFHSIEGAAQILGISRSSAYELANRWLRSNGEDGLPCVRLGRRIVVPSAAIARLAAVGGTHDPTTDLPAS